VGSVWVQSWGGNQDRTIEKGRGGLTWETLFYFAKSTGTQIKGKELYGKNRWGRGANSSTPHQSSQSVTSKGGSGGGRIDLLLYPLFPREFHTLAKAWGKENEGSGAKVRNLETGFSSSFRQRPGNSLVLGTPIAVTFELNLMWEKETMGKEGSRKQPWPMLF